jgi:N-acetylglucosamine-6-phosphate deacetylase
MPFRSYLHLLNDPFSPGFLDIQINGAYGFDFSIYEGDDQVYRDGLKQVAEKIVESGVTSYVCQPV